MLAQRASAIVHQNPKIPSIFKSMMKERCINPDTDRPDNSVLACVPQPGGCAKRLIKKMRCCLRLRRYAESAYSATRCETSKVESATASRASSTIGIHASTDVHAIANFWYFLTPFWLHQTAALRGYLLAFLVFSFPVTFSALALLIYIWTFVIL